jgi:hypothetical protein
MNLTERWIANRREPTIEEAKAIKKLVRCGDVYRESGGICYNTESDAKKAFVDGAGKPRNKRIGNVTYEENYALCRSSILLDWNSYDWKKVRFIWIAAELPKPSGYIDDECCDGCETRNIPANQFDRPHIQHSIRLNELSTPPKNFVSPGQVKWAQEFGIPVVVYQPATENPEPGEEDGAFDIYDPIKEGRKAIGINLQPLSKLAGSSIKDPAHLTAVAKEALEERTQHEFQIYRAWADYLKVYEASMSQCTQAYEKLLAENPAREKRLQMALQKMETRNSRSLIAASSLVQQNSLLKIPQQVATFSTSPTKSYALPPAIVSTLEELRFTPPMEAFAYVQVSG